MVSRRDLPLVRVRDTLPPGVDPAVILSLVATFPKQGTNLPSGSAIAISDHFALTARHVLEDYASRAAPEDTVIRAASAPDENHQQREWTIRATVTEPGTEIALLYLGEGGAPVKGLGFPTLQIAPPATDSKVIAVGFAESAAEPLHDDAWKWWERPIISRGRITEIHNQSRDPVLMPYPSFSADTFVMGGMSGGPAFSPGGELLGLVSTSNENESDPYAVFSLIWTALGLPLWKLNRSGDSRGFLLDLAVQGEILCSNLGRLYPVYGEGSDGPTLSLALST